MHMKRDGLMTCWINWSCTEDHEGNVAMTANVCSLSFAKGEASSSVHSFVRQVE
jgi:hypothetical protein